MWLTKALSSPAATFSCRQAQMLHRRMPHRNPPCGSWFKDARSSYRGLATRTVFDSPSESWLSCPNLSRLAVFGRIPALHGELKLYLWRKDWI